MPPKKKIDVHKKLSSRPECYICGKTFKNRRGLTTHLKTCTKNLERKKKINLTATQQIQKEISRMNTNKNSDINDLCSPMDIPFIQNEQYDSESSMIPNIDNESNIIASIHDLVSTESTVNDIILHFYHILCAFLAHFIVK